MTSRKPPRVALPGAHRREAKGRVYWYTGRERGAVCFWSGTLADEAAQALKIATAYVKAMDAALPEGTVGRLIEDYRKSDAFKRLAASTQALYGIFLDRALQTDIKDLALDEFGEKRGRDAIRRWRAKLAKTSPKNADNARVVLGAVATWGRQMDILPSDCEPCADMPLYYDAPPQDAWREDEIVRTRKALPEHLVLAVDFVLLTGFRRSDAVAVTRESIDRKANIIRWRTSKGRRFKREAIIDLTAELRAVVDRCEQLWPAAPTILATKLGRPWTPAGLANSLKAELRDLGIDKGLHGLRRSAATRLEAQGLSATQIARRLGWGVGEVEKMLATYVDPAARLDTPPENPA